MKTIPCLGLKVGLVLAGFGVTSAARAATAPSLVGIYTVADIKMYCDLGIPTEKVQITASAAAVAVGIYNGIPEFGPVGFIPKLGWVNGTIEKPSLGPGYQTEQDAGAYSADGLTFQFQRFLDHVLFDTQTLRASASGVLYTHQYAGGSPSICSLVPVN